MQEQQTFNLIDCILRITNRAIAMKDNQYVYLETKEPVEVQILEQATALKQELEAKLYTETLKKAKEIAKANIKVTTSSGKTFDGNESARNNMLSVIIASDILGETETSWKLADNTVATIILAELKEALALSIQKCGRIIMSATLEEL